MSTAQARTPELAPCPDSPNCVSSQSSDSHQVAPFYFMGEPDPAWLALIQALQASPRTRILVNEVNYLHASQTSLIFRFVDDLEFVLMPEQNRIDVRSASRVGYSDFGVNRRRIERLRQTLTEQGILVTQP